MSHNAIQQQRLDEARQRQDQKREASALLLMEVAASEVEWKRTVRASGSESSQAKASEQALAQMMQALKTAREQERQARDEVVGALKQWLGSDLAEDVKTLSTEYPIILLPVRLETRFLPVGVPNVLKVRIYPDEIMADTHEPWLTESERGAGETYWRAFWKAGSLPSDQQHAADLRAWGQLLKRFSATRAAWIVHETEPTNLAERTNPGSQPAFPIDKKTRPHSWTRAAEARVLPDRWIVLAYRDGKEVHRKLSNVVGEPLALTINPTASIDDGGDISAETLLKDQDVGWTFDFDQAEKAGMAVSVDLQAEDVANGFDRLLVVGVKASFSAEHGGNRLTDLLEAHHYTGGFALVCQGTPTNNTRSDPAGFPPDDPGGATSFAVEREALPVGPGNDGYLFLTALGVPPQLAAHIAGAERTEQQTARAMNAALWPVTLGYYLEQMMAPGRKPSNAPAGPSPRPFNQQAIQEARNHFVAHVHGRGPYPAFRVGGTPYGLLPVSSLDRWSVEGQQPDPVPDLVMLLVENRRGVNEGHYLVGWNMDATGTLTGSWSEPKQVAGDFGEETRGTGIAIAPIAGTDRPDLLVFHVEEQVGVNEGFYRIGWRLDSQGQVDHWSDSISVPGDFGRKTEGAGVAIADIDGDGQLDLVVFHVEREYITSPIFTGFTRRTRGYYRIGWKLDTQGRVDHWSDPIALPLSSQVFDRPGAALTVVDVDGDGNLDLVVLGFMDPTERGFANMGYYRIGWKLDTQGQVDHWSDPVLVQGAITEENLGAGIAVIDIDQSGQTDLVVLNIDRPQPGEKSNVFCRIGWNLDHLGIPTRWSEVVPAPGIVDNIQGAGIACAHLSSHWLAALRMLRDLWKEAAQQVPRIGRTGDPDQDLLEVLGMEASTREVHIRTVLGSDLLVNLYNYRGTRFFNMDWSTWSGKQQQMMDEILRNFATLFWDAGRNMPARSRIGDMVLDQYAYQYREALVTDEPLSSERGLPALIGGSYRNYIDWIVQTPPIPISGIPQGLMDTPTGEWPLLRVLLRHAMLIEYANAAFELLVDPAVKLVRQQDRREPELTGIVQNTLNRLSVRQRFEQPVTVSGSTRKVGDYLWHSPKARGTKALENYSQSLRLLMNVPTAELECLLTETLDVCSHRLDAWITSLASQRLQEMRAVQAQKKTGGSYLAAFGWVEDLRPAPASRYTTETRNGGTVLVQNSNGGYIHAPSMAHATAAAVLRNGYLTRLGNDRKRYAIDLSSEHVRTARWLLDAVRDGQPLGAVLGYRVERILHERALEIYIDPLRVSFPLATVKDARTDGTIGAMMARNVVDGLALRTAWPEKVPWGKHGLPGEGSAEQSILRATLDAELGALDASSRSGTNSSMDPLDAVADLLTAESVYQLTRGNTAASAAGLDAMAQGLRPPDPEVARMPQGGTAVTHRVALVLGKTASALSSSWPQATPRANAEPLLDAWVGGLLGDPANVACQVTYASSSTGNPQQWKARVVKLSDLGVRPLDVLAQAQGMQAVAQASELDQRVAYYVMSQAEATEDIDSQQVHIRYTAGPGWKNTTRTFLEILEMARSINAIIGGARPLRPEDVLLPEAATSAQQAVWAADETLQRATDAYDTLVKVKTDLLEKAIADLRAADSTHPPPDLLALRQALEEVARFGVSIAVPGSARGSSKKLAEALLAQASSVNREIATRLARADGFQKQLADQRAAAQGNDVSPQIKIQVATDILQAIFGRNFVVLTGFQPVEAVPGELRQALQAEPELIDASAVKRANTIRKWFQQVAHVRPALERWRKLWLYAGALETGQPQWQVMQLPYKSGERWAALPFSNEEQRPPSGRVSLVLHQTSSLTAHDTWTGLLLDEWNEVIPNTSELTGVAFHYDDPGAEAPQAVLVAVPPHREGNWDLETLIAILNETLDMTKIRAVDRDVLGPLGQVLPAIVLATNTASDTVSTDFSGLRRAE